jgi:hypothetical protein
MATKHTDTCLQNAGDDEPIFVLRAHDKCAPGVVRHWAAIAEAHRAPPNKVYEARALAERMLVWQAEHGCKVPD